MQFAILDPYLHGLASYKKVSSLSLKAYEKLVDSTICYLFALDVNQV
jgi:hypothetical protein